MSRHDYGTLSPPAKGGSRSNRVRVSYSQICLDTINQRNFMCILLLQYLWRSCLKNDHFIMISFFITFKYFIMCSLILFTARGQLTSLIISWFGIINVWDNLSSNQPPCNKATYKQLRSQTAGWSIALLVQGKIKSYFLIPIYQTQSRLVIMKCLAKDLDQRWHCHTLL